MSVYRYRGLCFRPDSIVVPFDSINMIQQSDVEESFLTRSAFDRRRFPDSEFADVIVANSFPELGLLTALRFIEFIQRKPNAVCSLPTGKTPEYFIKWVVRILSRWNDEDIRTIRAKYNIPESDTPPSLANIRFVQIDEFVPIDPSQTNSYNHYIRKYYLGQFGIDESKCLLMDTCHITRKYRDCGKLDLSLRYRDPMTALERDQRQLIVELDAYCADYERRIEEMGGIDFFLGGIGPDGHVGFNIRDSDPNAPTRLLQLNYESLASSAAEAHGGMSIARRLAVITIGLKTIRIKREDCTVIIFAAGESKSKIVKEAIEGCDDKCRGCCVPSHALRGCNLVFYLTSGSAKDSVSRRKIGCPEESAILDSLRTGKPLADPSILFARIDRAREYLSGGSKSGLKFFHTEPHHDDVALGYLPFILRARNPEAKNDVFVCCTSGFNSVANSFIVQLVDSAKSLVESGHWELATSASKQFELDIVSSGKPMLGMAIRFLRNFVLPGWSSDNVIRELDLLKLFLSSLYPGQKHPNRPDIESLKGQCREFESESVWHNLGYDVSGQVVFHLRMGFYTSDMFAPEPIFERDAAPIYELLLRENPDVVTVALDPESSGPDTHYKVLQAVTAAVERFESVTEKSITIWGYRNVWYTFELFEADLIFPVSVEELEKLSQLFLLCYQSQKTAEFPSYQLDGPFSALVDKQFRDQLKDLTTCLGGDTKNFDPHARGVLLIKEMTTNELRNYSRSLRQTVENF